MPESKSGAFTNLATPLEDLNSNTFFWAEIQNSENLVQNVLPSFRRQRGIQLATNRLLPRRREAANEDKGDRKSTRLNSSHQIISYAVFCLKKKKNKREHYNNSTENTDC